MQRPNDGLAFFLDTSGNLALYEGPEPWGPWNEVFEGTLLDSTEKLGVSFVNKEGWLSADGRTWWAVFGGVNEYDGFNVIRATLTTVASP